MSLCISLYNQDHIYVWADSRVSSEVNGKSYVVTDDYRKIRKVGDKVVFISGDVELAEYVFTAISESSTIDFIQKKAQEAYGSRLRIDSELGVFIHTIESRTPVFYQMSYYNGFKIDRKAPNTSEIFTAAARSNEALHFVAELIKRGTPVPEAVIKTYEHLSNEDIGGNLHTFIVNNAGIVELTSKIKDKQIYPKWRGRPFTFHADMKGNVVARSITLTGLIEQSTMMASHIHAGTINGTEINGSYVNGGTITGALIRTSAGGRRIELDSRGFRATDSTGAARISIQTDSEQGISGIGFNDRSGSWQGQIIATDDDFSMTAKKGLYFDSGIGPIILNSNVQFKRGVSGLEISHIAGLSTQLTGLSNQIGGKADLQHTHDEYATSMAYDKTTGNLKIYNRKGFVLATVNIKQ